MTSSEDDEVVARLGRRAEEIKRGGTVSPSLLMQVMADVTILSDRMTTAERQRLEIMRKLDDVSKSDTQLAILNQQVTHNGALLTALLEKERKNTEFRLKFEGGSVIVKLVWLALGGGLVWIMQMLLDRAR